MPNTYLIPGDVTPANVATAIGANPAAIRTALGVRETLTAQRTYYVRVDGSDANDGLTDTAGGAFRTIQKAVDTVCSLDFGVNNGTIQLGAGTHTTATDLFLRPTLCAGTITIRGNPASPDSVVVTRSTGGNVVTVSSDASVWWMDGFTIGNANAGSSSLRVNTGRVAIKDMNFSAVPYYGILLKTNTTCYVAGNLKISGNMAAFLNAEFGSCYTTWPGVTPTITITGTPAFSAGFVSLMAAYAYMVATYTGGATGPRYVVDRNGVCHVNGGGATYLPGNTAGSVTNGGSYA